MNDLVKWSKNKYLINQNIKERTLICEYDLKPNYLIIKRIDKYTIVGISLSIEMVKYLIKEFSKEYL